MTVIVSDGLVSESDYHLFPTMKQNLACGHENEDDGEMENFVTRRLRTRYKTCCTNTDL